MHLTKIQILFVFLVVKLAAGCAISSNLYHSHIARISGFVKTVEIDRNEHDSLIRINEKLYISASYLHTKDGNTCENNNKMHLSFYTVDSSIVDMSSFVIIREDETNISLNSFKHFIGNWKEELSKVHHDGSLKQILLEGTMSYEEMEMARVSSYSGNINLLELTFTHAFGCGRERYILNFKHRLNQKEEFEYATLYFSPISYRYISL